MCAPAELSVADKPARPGSAPHAAPAQPLESPAMSIPMASSADVTARKQGKRVSAFAHGSLRDELVELINLAWPIVFSRLGMMAMGLVDVLVVSHYSTKARALRQRCSSSTATNVQD